MNLGSLFARLFEMARKNQHKSLIFKKMEQCGKKAEEILDQKIIENLKGKNLDELCQLLELRLEATEVSRSDQIERCLSILGDHFQRDMLEVLYARKLSRTLKSKELKKWAKKNLASVLDRAKNIADLLSSVPDLPKFETLSFILSCRQREITLLLIEIIGILDPQCRL